MKKQKSVIWRFRKTGILFLAAMCLALLWGCEKSDEMKESALPENTAHDVKNDPETLGKTALSYWNHRLVTRDYKASYGLEAKAGLPAFEEYVKLVSRTGKFVFSALKVDETKVEENTGKVKISLMAKGPGMPAAFDRTFNDVWTFSKTDGWRHHFSKIQP